MYKAFSKKKKKKLALELAFQRTGIKHHQNLLKNEPIHPARIEVTQFVHQNISLLLHQNVANHCS